MTIAPLRCYEPVQQHKYEMVCKFELKTGGRKPMAAGMPRFCAIPPSMEKPPVGAEDSPDNPILMSFRREEKWPPS
jgi:hypothetical protein